MADNIFIKEVQLFDETDKPIFFISPQHRQYHHHYFTFNEKAFGIKGRPGIELGIEEYDSFIIEFMMYNRKISHEMLAVYGGLDGFFNMCYNVVTNICKVSDAELYPCWCVAKHPNAYTIKKNIRTRQVGKQYPDNYTDEQLIAEIELSKTDPESIQVTCHTWRDE